MISRMRFVPKALYSFAQYASNALDTSVGVYTLVVIQFHPSVLFSGSFELRALAKSHCLPAQTNSIMDSNSIFKLQNGSEPLMSRPSSGARQVMLLCHLLIYKSQPRY